MTAPPRASHSFGGIIASLNLKSPPELFASDIRENFRHHIVGSRARNEVVDIIHMKVPTHFRLAVALERKVAFLDCAERRGCQAIGAAIFT